MNARGFTLVEWLIAMLIGVFLIGGGLSVFVASRATTEDAFDQSELQENGRIAMRLLTQDLKWAGFWGDYTGSPMVVGLGVTVDAKPSANNCLNNSGQEGSLPSSVGANRSLWVVRINASKAIVGGAFSCIPVSERIAGTDVISVKRLIGHALPSLSTAADLIKNDDNKYYMATTTQAAHIFPIDEARGDKSIPVDINDEKMPNRQFWVYQHFLYYISPNDKTGNPELKKRFLTPNGGSVVIGGAMAEGIEKISVLFGVDDSPVPDGVIDRYVATSNVTEQEWSEGRVVAARIFILVRSLQASGSYVNNNVYQVGDVPVFGNGDGYRRLLLESSVSLRNPTVIAGGGK
ncbi:PilW family protein [Aeromonas sp. S16(2024)]|uniref:PilW family protein n=1 Tax=Aeromonas sp. S16(2024) TaxID=3242889 RepID=UPI003527AB9F